MSPGTGSRPNPGPAGLWGEHSSGAGSRTLPLRQRHPIPFPQAPPAHPLAKLIGIKPLFPGDMEHPEEPAVPPSRGDVAVLCTTWAPWEGRSWRAGMARGASLRGDGTHPGLSPRSFQSLEHQVGFGQKLGLQSSQPPSAGPSEGQRGTGEVSVEGAAARCGAVEKALIVSP